MSNPHRGGVTLQVGDRSYTLSFSVNAICELEEEFGEPVGQIAKSFEDSDNVRMTKVRTLIWASLRDHHQDVSVKDAGDIATEAGVPRCMDAIGRAFALAFPAPEAEEVRPRKAASNAA